MVFFQHSKKSNFIQVGKGRLKPNSNSTNLSPTHTGTLKVDVPEAYTDYIFSVISEEFGVIIVLAIMIIFLILSYNILKKINYENDDKVKLILAGIASIILFQTFIHIGVNIRLLPTTGMTLPYLSYGGSSIISTSILSGIILNLTKRKIN